MGACSSSHQTSSNRVGSRDDADVEQQHPIDPTDHPVKVAEIIYNSMRQRPKPLETCGTSPTNSHSPSGDQRRGLAPPGTLSSRARTSSRNLNSKKTRNQRENMFDLSALNASADSIPSPTTPEMQPSSNELGSRRLAFVQTAAERENSLLRENSLCAPPTFIRKTSGTVSRVNDSDDSGDETDGEPADLTESIRMQRGRHSRNVSVSLGGGMIEAIMLDASSPPRPVRLVLDSPRVHGSPLTSPRTLGFPGGLTSPDSSKRRLKDVPFAQQVMQKQFEGGFETEFIPAPYKSLNKDSPLLNSRRGVMAFDIPSLDEANGDKVTEIAIIPDAKRESTPRSPPVMSRQVSSMRSERIWTHYAGKENKHMFKKGLRQLSEDVYDEFVQRYKTKLFEINQASFEKKGEVYTDEHAERDLAVDLPILLPVANKKATHDDFVKFVYSFLLTEMSKPAPGQKSQGPESPSRGSLNHSHSRHSQGADPKLSKIQFVLGWNHAQEVLFQIIERIQPEEKNQSPCKLM